MAAHLVIQYISTTDCHLSRSRFCIHLSSPESSKCHPSFAKGSFESTSWEMADRGKHLKVLKRIDSQRKQKHCQQLENRDNGILCVTFFTRFAKAATKIESIDDEKKSCSSHFAFSPANFFHCLCEHNTIQFSIYLR